MTADDSQSDPPENVAALLDRIDAGWRRFHEAIAGIPDERMGEPGVTGDWSLQNLFGHIAFWEDIAVQKIPHALAGQPSSDGDVQALNAADHAARRGRSLPEERAAMEQAHAALVAQLETIAGADAGALDAAVRDDTYLHYDEHRAEIAAWRRRHGL